MKQKIRIIVAHSQRMVLDLFSFFIDSDESFEVLKKVENGRELLDELKLEEAEILIIDPNIEVVTLTEVLKIIKVRHTKLKVAMILSPGSPEDVKQYVSIGIRAFLDLNSKGEAIKQTINQLMIRGNSFSNDILQMVLENYVSGEDRNNNKKLNLRQLEILSELHDGKSTKEIASKLNISANTVNYHKKIMYSSTGSHNLLQLLKNTMNHNTDGKRL